MPDILLVLFIVSLLPIVLAGVAIHFRVAELGKFLQPKDAAGGGHWSRCAGRGSAENT